MFAAAQNRAAAITALLAHGADPKITTKFIDIAKQGAIDRAATDIQRRVLEASVPAGQRPTASQIQAAMQAAREILASGRIPPPPPAAAGAGGRGGRGGRGGASTGSGQAPSTGSGQAAGAAADAPAGAPADVPPAATA